MFTARGAVYNEDSYTVFLTLQIVLKRSKHDLLSTELSDVARHIRGREDPGTGTTPLPGVIRRGFRGVPEAL